MISLQKQHSFPNKFIYPEFLGDSGEKHLKDILHCIITSAEWRTWEICTIIQKDEEAPYIGVSRISKGASRCQRQIYTDLESLIQKGLLKLEPGRKFIEGAIRPVTYKNFDNLYHLAHEYHLWISSTAAQEYPPERAIAPSIKEQPDLYKKLQRFNNYHKILNTQKPGPKKQGCNARDYEQEERSLNLYLIKDSLYRVSITDSNSIYNSSDSRFDSEGRGEETDSYSQSYAPPAMGYTNPNTKKGPQGLYKIYDTARLSQQDRMECETLENSYRDYEQRRGWPEQKTDGKKRPQRNALIEHMIGYFSPVLNDQATASSISQALDIFEKANITDEEVIRACIFEARRLAQKKSNVKQKDKQGRANRMPYFMTVLRQKVEAYLRYLQFLQEQQEPEPATSAQIEAAIEMHCTIEAAPTPTENDQTQQEITTMLEQPETIETELVEQRNEAYVATVTRRAHQGNNNPAPAITVIQDNVIWTEASQPHDEATIAIRRSLKPYVGSNFTLIGKPCQHCGCTISYMNNKQQRQCVYCQPAPEWHGSINRIREIVKPLVRTENRT